MFPEIVMDLAARAFRVWDVEKLAPLYRLTLDHWSERFERVVPAVLEKGDERFVGMWRLYFARFFRRFLGKGTVSVYRSLILRGRSKDLSLTRGNIY